MRSGDLRKRPSLPAEKSAECLTIGDLLEARKMREQGEEKEKDEKEGKRARSIKTALISKMRGKAGWSKRKKKGI